MVDPASIAIANANAKKLIAALTPAAVGAEPAGAAAAITAASLGAQPTGVVDISTQSYVSSLIASGTLVAMPVESGYTYVLVDGSGRIAFGIRMDGTVVAKFSLANGAVDFPQLSAAVTAGLTQQQPAEAGLGNLWAVVDATGHIALSVDATGRVTLSKVSLPAGSVDTAQLSTALAATIGSAGATPIPAEESVAYAIVDLAGRAALQIGLDGTVTMSKFAIPASAVDTPQLSAAVLSGLLQQEPIESGYAWSVVGASGRLALGITPDGTVVMPKTSLAAYSMRDAESPGYLVHPFRDSSSKYQLRVHRRSDSQVTIVTSGTTNSVEPVLTEDNHLIYQNDATGVMRGYHQVADGGPAWPVVPLMADGICCWGDSLTAGSGSSDGGYPAHLASLLSVPVSNQGVGGQGIESIAARQGGTPALLTVTGNQIPASGAVTVTAMTITPYSSTTAGSPSSGVGSLAGVGGTLSNDGYNNLTFTRTAAGSVTACPAGTPWVSTASITYQASIQMLWLGRNSYSNGDTPAQIVASIQSCIAFLKPYVKRYLVFQIPPFTPGDASGAGTLPQGSSYNLLVAANAALAAAFGANYVPVADYLRGSAMTDLGLTVQPQDTTDIANAITPTSLRAGYGTGTVDNGHLNNTGYTAVAMRVQQAILAKGWN